MELVNRKRFMLFSGSANPQLARDVAEEMGYCYAEAGAFAEAREFLDGLRELDPTFGGDPTRRDRMVRHMHDLDRR